MNSKKGIFILLLAVISTALFSNSALASTPGGKFAKVKPITTNHGSQGSGAIYGNNAVYVDYNNGSSDIFLYNLITRKETQITKDSSFQRHPDIYKDKIVWVEGETEESDIYLYDLTTKEQLPIAVAPGIQTAPKIYENFVVWEDYRYGNGEIYLYDLNTKEERRVTVNPATQQSPDIFGDTIVWSDSRHGVGAIYMYEISVGEESRVSNAGSSQNHPVIYEDKIVWEDFRNNNLDLYMYDLSTEQETQITNSPDAQMFPDIWEGKIVYENYWYETWDGDNNTNIIHLYDIQSGEDAPIHNDTHKASSAKIHQDIIVWSSIVDYNPDVYMANLRTKLPDVNVSLKVGNPNMTIDGEVIEIDPGRGTKPLVVKGTTLVPLRAFIEALGGTVAWNRIERKVTIDIINKNIELWIDKKEALVDGETRLLEVPPRGINGRTMLPLRFVAETLGMEVGWDGQTGSITLTTY